MAKADFSLDEGTERYDGGTEVEVKAIAMRRAFNAGIMYGAEFAVDSDGQVERDEAFEDYLMAEIMLTLLGGF